MACIRAPNPSLARGLVTARQGNDSSVCTPADDACIPATVLIVLLHSIAGEEQKVLQASIRLRLQHSCFTLDRLREIWINRLRALSNAVGVRGVRAPFLALLPSLFSIVHWLRCVFCSVTMHCFQINVSWVMTIQVVTTTASEKQQKQVLCQRYTKHKLRLLTTYRSGLVVVGGAFDSRCKTCASGY